jgi:hypothetical protein
VHIERGQSQEYGQADHQGARGVQGKPVAGRLDNAHVEAIAKHNPVDARAIVFPTQLLQQLEEAGKLFRR